MLDLGEKGGVCGGGIGRDKERRNFGQGLLMKEESIFKKT